jgi:hypothetical protein
MIPWMFLLLWVGSQTLQLTGAAIVVSQSSTSRRRPLQVRLVVRPAATA